MTDSYSKGDSCVVSSNIISPIVSECTILTVYNLVTKVRVLIRNKSVNTVACVKSIHLPV